MPNNGKPYTGSLAENEGNTPHSDTDKSQEDVIAFVTDPKTIASAAEGSMEKRQVVFDTDKSELEKALLGFKGGYGGQSISSIQALIEQQCNQAILDKLKLVSVEANKKMYPNGIEDFVDNMIAEIQAKETETE